MSDMFIKKNVALLPTRKLKSTNDTEINRYRSSSFVDLIKLLVFSIYNFCQSIMVFTEHAYI